MVVGVDAGAQGIELSDEGSELSGLGIVGFLHGKFAVGFEDELGDALAVALVGLGPGELEGFAPVFEGGGLGIDFVMAVRARVGIRDGEIDGAIGSVDADESGMDMAGGGVEIRGKRLADRGGEGKTDRSWTRAGKSGEVIHNRQLRLWPFGPPPPIAE